MANARLELHEVLVGVLGSRNVYFQPPETIRLSYPCIIYELSKIHVSHANDLPYWKSRTYSITLIDEDPDSDLPDKMLNLPRCVMDRFFVSDNLNHWVFTINYDNYVEE